MTAATEATTAASAAIQAGAWSLACATAHSTNSLKGLFRPGEKKTMPGLDSRTPGVLSQNLSFRERSQRFMSTLLGDGCRLAPIVFEGGEGHRRTCTASRGCSTACRANRTSSTPSATCIATRDDTTNTDRTPSAALAESIVCADSWMHVPSHSLMGATGSKVWGSECSMALSVPGQALAGPMHSHQGGKLL